ncbi:hypothetical protein A3F02_02220 [Candidatus Curtissbacteria bacterium RIFCSPHIGHO2_12_FULL_38_9b]|uniref:Uncharacterized protein n=1 Tax=Candidatus Curtissbacteria bacterium RIFCSPHIGHO2_12_FULL_38_9b TaxID=1797720 RepID=A0A1F5GVE6_9BACT|nr:MAG: hypothetical protein A3F02_02220 [Candidatus Curtissbacteria bacterium RIFCSPHIGHO2_12_FULL_38_9b]
MKEVAHARETVEALEQSLHEQVKGVVKDLLSSLDSSDFPKELSNKGTIPAFIFGYQAGAPLLAAPTGLFHAQLRNWGLIHESSIVIDESVIEADAQLYYQYAERIFERVERRAEGKRRISVAQTGSLIH